MTDRPPNNLTPEQQAEQERLQQAQARRQNPQIHSRPRELAKKAKAGYGHAKEFIADPKAKMNQVGQQLKDKATQPVNQAKDAINTVQNAPKNIADKAKKTVDAVKNAPKNIKKGIDTAKAGAQAIKAGLQAGRVAGGLLAKGGAKAAVGTAAGAATGGVGTAALAAADVAAAAAKAGVKVGRKVLKQFGADVIGKMEDKVWDTITEHFRRHWKAYVAGLFIFPMLIFVFAFTAVYLASNSGFDKDSPTGQADIASFESIANSGNITFASNQLNDFINQVKAGMVNPRLVKFLNTVGKNHKLNISAITSDNTDDPNIVFDPVQIKIDTVDSIKCTNTKTKAKYQEFPIYLNQSFDWKSLIPTDEKLKGNVLCAVDYYPVVESPKTITETQLYNTFSPGEFPIETLETSGRSATQIKIAELIIEADNYPTDNEGINLAPASMEVGSDLAEKNFHNPSDVSLRTYFKARANINIEDVDSLFQSPSSLDGGALVLFL